MTALRVLLILIGIILTLPGLCSLASLFIFGTEVLTTDVSFIWLAGMGIGALGVWLIYANSRKRTRP